jgi:tRNA pseudouridine synthase 10
MLELAKQILDECDGKICKNCLGRKLSKTVEGSNNIERADKVCNELGITLDGECIVCDNLFDKLNDDLYKRIDDKINQLGVEFDTFLVGSKISKDIQKRDEELSEKFDLNVETIKKEVNRLIGLGIWEIYGKEAEFESQDIVFNVDLIKNPKVRIQINPLYVEGKYNKWKRGIPQTKWPCTKCKERGCEECNFTGKQYPESVEELISEHFLKLTKGREAKFHGAGREDIDVLMLGSGRPFVLEIKEPKIRKLDLPKLEEEINRINEGKTSYHNLHVCE